MERGIAAGWERWGMLALARGIGFQPVESGTRVHGRLEGNPTSDTKTSLGSEQNP